MSKEAIAIAEAARAEARAEAYEAYKADRTIAEVTRDNAYAEAYKAYAEADKAFNKAIDEADKSYAEAIEEAFVEAFDKAYPEAKLMEKNT